MTQVQNKTQVAPKASKVIQTPELSDSEKYEYIMDSFVSDQLKQKAEKVYHELELMVFACHPSRLRDKANYVIQEMKLRKAILIGELNQLYRTCKVLNLRQIEIAMEEKSPLKYTPLTFAEQPKEVQDKISEEIQEIFKNYEEESVYCFV
jgi:hypothetical protein